LRGIEPVVLTPRYRSEDPAFEKADGIEVIRAPPFGLLLKERHFLPSAWDPVRVISWLNRIKQATPDVVHLHGPDSPMFGAALAQASWSPVAVLRELRCLGPRVVVTFHTSRLDCESAAGRVVLDPLQAD